MELITILIIVAAIIALVLFITLVKNIIKIVLFTLGLVIILALLFGLIAYMDARSIKNSMETGAKTLIYTRDGEPLTGISIPAQTDVQVQGGSFSGGVRALSKQELLSMTNNTDLIITIDEEWLWDVSDSYTVLNTELNREQTNALLSDQQPAMAQALGLNEKEFKAFVVFSIMSQALKMADTNTIIAGIREETITIKPTLISANIIKLIPERALSSALKNTINEPKTNGETQ